MITGRRGYLKKKLPAYNIILPDDVYQEKPIEMCKTLHADPSLTIPAAPASASMHEEAFVLPAELVKEMQPYWREAAGDLLRPRPEAVAKLLEKVSR